MVLHSLNYGTSHKLNTSPALFVLEGIQNHVACFKFISSSSCQTIKWQLTLIMDNLTKKGSHIWMRVQRMSLWLNKNTDRLLGLDH